VRTARTSGSARTRTTDKIDVEKRWQHDGEVRTIRTTRDYEGSAIKKAVERTLGREAGTYEGWTDWKSSQDPRRSLLKRST